MSDFTLSINNREIYKFYHEHNINFEEINVLLFSLLKQLMQTGDHSFNSNIAATLLTKVDNIERSIAQQQTDWSLALTNQLNEYKQNHIAEIKQLLASHSSEQLTPLIHNVNDRLIDKTTILINELMPKNHELVTKNIDFQFKFLQSFIEQETSRLLSSTITQKSVDDFFSSTNFSFSQSIDTITKMVSNSEQRLENRISESLTQVNEIKALYSQNNFAQTALQNSVNEMLKKFEKGVGKGNVSEHVLYNILLSLYPCAQIDHVGNDLKETGDIMLVRNNRPKILIENKDHQSCNVPKHDVDKFIRDCEIQNCCGVMFAQHRGIANKENFEIQIHRENVLLYVHETNFNAEIIKTAIDIVEQFKTKLDELQSQSHTYTIDSAVLEEINREFNLYVTQKQHMIKLIKDFSDKMESSITALKQPNLEIYLSKHFATSAKQNENICKYCEAFIPKSMLQHYRYCAAKKKAEATTASPSITP